MISDQSFKLSLLVSRAAQARSRVAVWLLNCWLIAMCCFPAAVWAQVAGSGDTRKIGQGTVAGRVINAANGVSLNNARVLVMGTRLETTSENDGHFVITGVPVGEVQLSVSFTGMATKVVSVEVSPGSTIRQDFELQLDGWQARQSDGVLVLEKFTVQLDDLSNQAVALQERRHAPNIKNVVAIEGDMAEGNVGEFLREIPGIALDLNPQSPAFASVRGMPASGTVITTDGEDVASASHLGRSVDLGLAATGNIERIEVSKVPTPDMPANAVGGSINLVSKSAFRQKKPIFNYNLFLTASTRDGWESSAPGDIFGRSLGVDGRSDMRRINPSVNLSYLLPINRDLAMTFAFSQSSRYTDWDFRRATWNKLTGMKTSDTINPLPFGEDKTLLSSKVEWRVNQHHFTASASYSAQDLFTRQNPVVVTFGTAATGSATYSEGALTGAARSSIAMNPSGNNQDKSVFLASLTHRFTGKDWKFDASASFSQASFIFTDMEDGFFGSMGSNMTALRIRQDFAAPGSRDVAYTTAVYADGSSVANLYDGNAYTVNTAGSAARRIDDKVIRAKANVSRNLDFGVPVTLKLGADISVRKNEDEGGAKSWTFTPPGGAAAKVARNYDLIANEFSSISRFTDARGNPLFINFLSLSKLKSLYDANPAWFVLNEAAAHTAAANATKDIEEVVAAGYVRGDVRFLQNRLWLVGGVRFEHTADSGRGVSNDLLRTFQRDPAGNLIKNGNNYVKKTGTALELAQWQYVIKGAKTKSDYYGFYPSLNASYSLTSWLVARAGYARTIGRPNFPDIIPGLTVVDPNTVEDGSRTITWINTALKPWTANNYDLTLETYQYKGATAALSLFQKDISGFFEVTRSPTTPESLAEMGLSDDYLNYTVVSKRNGGSASLRGIEMEYRQSLIFLPRWAQEIQLFGNVTAMDLGGPNADDFTGFTKRTGSWGVSLVRPKFNMRFSVNYTGTRRIAKIAESASVAPMTYTQYEPQTRVNLSGSYMFNKYISVYMDIRNLTGDPSNRGNWAPDTPEYARLDLIQYAGAMFTLGIKGRF